MAGGPVCLRHPVYQYSAWVVRSSPSVCLTVCPEHNSKTKDPKAFKLGIKGMTLGYPRSGMILGLKGQRSRVGLGLELTATRRRLELYVIT